MLLALKLVIAPLLIGVTSLAARRFGHAVAGLIVSLPLTSGPIVVLVALEHGTDLAVEVGLATLAGGFALCAYSLAAAAAARSGPWTTVGAGSLAFAAVAVVIDLVDPVSLPVLLGGVGLGLAATLRLLPPGRAAAESQAHPRWDLPLRILVGTALIVGISTAAPLVGPRVAGLLATYPVYVSTLTVFAHLRDGPGAAIAMQRGLITGLFGWLAFWAVLLPTLPSVGPIGVLFAALAALLVEGAALRVVRGSPVEPAA